jgi:hypothetical protein
MSITARHSRKHEEIPVDVNYTKPKKAQEIRAQGNNLD